MGQNSDKEAELTIALVLALHEGHEGEAVAKINNSLQKHNLNPVNNLMTIMLREAIILDLDGSIDNFSNFWFMKTVQSTIRKFEEYGCTWALTAGCITAVMGFSEVASAIPKNIASFVSAMIIANLIDNATQSEEIYKNILSNLGDIAEEEMKVQKTLYASGRLQN